MASSRLPSGAILPQTAADSGVPRRRWRIALLLAFGVLVNFFDRINLSVSRDALHASFGLSLVAFGYLSSAISWTYALMQMPAGVLLDRLGGAAPAHITLDQTGRYALVSNYNAGSVAVFPVLKDGRLGEATSFVQHKGSSVNPQRQEGPHAHAIALSPDNRFAVVADLGLDQLLVYSFDSAKGTLGANPQVAKASPGAGPRHLAFSADGRFLYVINELQSTVVTYSYNAATGALHELQTISTLPKTFSGNNTAAEIEIHPSGKFLLASNRGDDGIAVFAIDSATGTLTHVENDPTKGKTPRHFAIDLTGSWLLAANQDSDNIVVFRIDQKTGHLTPTGDVFQVPSPTCLKFVTLQ